MSTIGIESAADIEQAYRTFACHLIATIVEDLKTWAVPHANLKSSQKQQLAKDFRATDLFEIYHFFQGKPTSGLEDLIAGLQLQLQPSRILPSINPLLVQAIQEANRYRLSQGLEVYQLQAP